MDNEQHLYHLQSGDGSFRERGRGRGKGTTRSYRKIARQVSTPDSAPAGLGSPQAVIGGLSQHQQQQPQQQSAQQSIHSDSMHSTKDNLNPAVGQQTSALRNGNSAPPVVSMSPGVMPFYGDAGTGFRPAAGFGNAVWHQSVTPVGTVTVEATPGSWPPQQFIQQVPASNQLEELRYHPQYSAATPYHPQPVTYQQQAFISTDQSAFQRAGAPGQYAITAQTATLTPVTSQASTTQRPMNGQFVESPAQSYERQEYVNGYQQQDVSMNPQPATTPTSRSNSTHLEPSQQQQAQTQTQTTQNSQSTTIASTNDTQVKGFAAIAQNNVSGNEMPGYPLPPAQQSLHNSNGYPGYVEMGQIHQQEGQWQRPGMSWETKSNEGQDQSGNWQQQDARINWQGNDVQQGQAQSTSQHIQQQQWGQQKIEGGNTRSTPSNQVPWPDTPTSQPNWSPGSVKSENQVQWSPSSESQATWNQQNTKQELQNSGERMLWQNEQKQSNDFQENADNSENGVYQQPSNRVTSRLKTMILNKQQQQQQQQHHQQMLSQHASNSDFSSDERARESHENEKNLEKRGEQYQNNRTIQPNNESLTGNFLLHEPPSYLPGGGGLWSWTGGGIQNDTRHDSKTRVSRRKQVFLAENENRIEQDIYEKQVGQERKYFPENPTLQYEIDERYYHSQTEKGIFENLKGQKHVENLRNDVTPETPECDCLSGQKRASVQRVTTAFYPQLGTAPNLVVLRSDFENRTGWKGKDVRIEKVVYTGIEGRTAQGCPIAKWVIRRSSLDEKVLIIVKHREGHKCVHAWVIVSIVDWDGITQKEADECYSLLCSSLVTAKPTARTCAKNKAKLCACQGFDMGTDGASYSFGCSWSMYYNSCKFAKSPIVRKFSMANTTDEQRVEEKINALATMLSPMYAKMVPQAYKNQVQFEDEAADCRLGTKPGRPFAGATVCLDFCAHSHKDLLNMKNGCTLVVSLTRHRSLSKPEDEQLHVLPLYVMDQTDEFGSEEGQQKKIRTGAIEALNKFPSEVRISMDPKQPPKCKGNKRKNDKLETPKTTKIKNSAQRKFSKADINQNLFEVPFDGMDAQLQDSTYPFLRINVDVPKAHHQNQQMADEFNPDYTAEDKYRGLTSLEDQGPMSRTDSMLEYDSFQEYSASPGSAMSSPFPSGRSSVTQDSGILSESPYSDGRPNSTGNNSFYSPENRDYRHQLSYNWSFQESQSLESLQSRSGRYSSNFETNLLETDQTSAFRSLESLGANQEYYEEQKLDHMIPKPMIGVMGISQNEECFKNPQMGGVAIALGHGSVLYECAKYELHATTALKRPDRGNPSRISLVFYQHRRLNFGSHGRGEWAEKTRLRNASKSGANDPSERQTTLQPQDNAYFVPMNMD